MLARDVMTAPVITAGTSAKVVEIVNLMLEHNISAVPIVNEAEELVGIVSEGDLIQRDEIGTLPHRSWWLWALATKAQLANEFVKSHGATAGKVMTRQVCTAAEDTPLHEIAETLESRRIKRMPIVAEGKVCGIVSRANLLQALVLQKAASEDVPSADDKLLKKELLDKLNVEPWADTSHLNVIVKQGVVYIWGQVKSQAEREALLVAVSETPNVKEVIDHTDRSVTVY